MNILITGICGFVGSEIALSLLDLDATLEISGLDNFSRNGSWLNREILIKRGVDVVHGDIRNPADLETLGPFDWVIDAAANPSVLAGVDGKSSSRQLIENNLGGTINLLEACKTWKAGFILLSTSRVYSIPPLAALKVEVQNKAYHPVFSENPPSAISNPQSAIRNQPSPISPQGITESFSTAPPISLYGSSKLTSESLALEYGLTFDFPVWINRCGVMAGARQFGKPDQGIFAFWLHSWREGRPLKYIGFDGFGHQVRDCLHPRDLASLLIKQIHAGNSKTSSESEPNGVEAQRIINVSGGLDSAMSLRQLSDWCVDRFPDSPTKKSLPMEEAETPSNIDKRPFDLPWVVLDATQASSIWDWKPQVPVDMILEEIATFAAAHPRWIETSA